MKSILYNIRISPKKVNLIAKLVRRKPVNEALNILRFLPKRSGRPLMLAIKSAASNATHNYKQKLESLMVEKIVVNKGPTLKRARPVSRGRSHPIKKRTSHVTVEVAVKPESKNS